jgi:hypothetical protein
VQPFGENGNIPAKKKKAKNDKNLPETKMLKQF